MNTPTSTTTVNTPATTRSARRTARDRLVRLLAGYLPVLPRDLRDAVLAAQQALKLSEPKAASPLEIRGPDSDRVFVDRDGRAHRVEDLPDDLRGQVEAAIERSRTEPAVLPSNECLREASLFLTPHLRTLPEDERIVAITAVARALVDLEVRVRAAHRPPMTLERFAALMCPHCVLFKHSSEIPPAISRGLVLAGERVRGELVGIWGEAEVPRREDAIAQGRMLVAQGRAEPPVLQGRGVAAGGGTNG